MKKVLFIIRQFNVGGAQKQLTNLSLNLDSNQFEPYIISYYPGGIQEEKVKKSGIKYFCLNKKGKYDISFLIHLILKIRTIDPDIIYTFLATSNLLSILLKPIFYRKKYIWSLRDTYHTNKKIISSIIHTFLKYFSYLIPDLIIANSFAGRKSYINYGYEKDKISVISNGIDLDVFNYNPAKRKAFRKKNGFDEKIILIGIIGRFAEMKGHKDFLLASKNISKIENNCRFLIVGNGSKKEMGKIVDLINQLNMEDKVIITHPKSSLVDFYNGIDIITSTSVYGEGASNVLLEALACNSHCVATKIGDSKLIINDNDYLFMPGQNDKLYDCWIKKIKFIRSNKIASTRNHIVKNFSIENLVSRHEKIFSDLIKS
jgi:glycosyltransferase involved in cell wall biosynthesis